MLRGAINPAPEAYKRFDPGGQGLAYDVSLAYWSTILPFTTSKGDISTANMRSCMSCAPDGQYKTFDPGGPASTTKAS